MKNKKGSIFDVIILSVILFILALFIIFGYKIMTEFDTEFQTNDDLASESKSIMSDLKGRFVNLFDGIFFAFMILFAIAIAVGAYYFPVHPVFFVMSIFIIIFVVILAAVFANTYSDISEASEISSPTAEFTLMPFIFNNYVLFIMVLAFLIVIIMYAKQREGG